MDAIALAGLEEHRDTITRMALASNVSEGEAIRAIQAIVSAGDRSRARAIAESRYRSRHRAMVSEAAEAAALPRPVRFRVHLHQHGDPANHRTVKRSDTSAWDEMIPEPGARS